LAKRNPHDPPRLNVLDTALKELAVKHAPGKHDIVSPETMR
jgi:hypothetical protein